MAEEAPGMRLVRVSPGRKAFLAGGDEELVEVPSTEGAACHLGRRELDAPVQPAVRE
jgi:hypothetical protein